MPVDTHDKAAVEERLWKEIEKVRTVMVGLTVGDSRHLQPMTAFAEPETRRLWFFTKSDSDLVRESHHTGDAVIAMQARDDQFQASLVGRLVEDRHRAIIDRFWSPVLAAWYPAGKDDPTLTLLRFTPSDAEVWIAAGGGPLRFFWEVAKANATDKEPDAGDRVHLNLH